MPHGRVLIGWALFGLAIGQGGIFTLPNGTTITPEQGLSLILDQWEPTCFVDNKAAIKGYPLLSNGASEFSLSNPILDGFVCPNCRKGDIKALPRYCPPNPKCAGQRLGGGMCEAQGDFEPIVCKNGTYCPEFNVMLECPEGYYCPTGTKTPKKCEFGESCPAGSFAPLNWGALLYTFLIDISLLLAYISYYSFERRRILKHANPDVSPTFRMVLIDPVLNWFRRTILKKKVSDEFPALTHLTPQAVKLEKFKTFYMKALKDIKVRMNFKFEEMGLRLPTGKVILEGVTGEIRSGKVTAIMGPSGAGKTTFMHTLMGKISRTSGKLWLNGEEAEIYHFRKLIGYVPQDDVMHRDLTVRENILHSARIRLPSSWKAKEIEEFVDIILDILNLKHVAHTIIGDELTRGVSGGQRKRVSIGMELAACPFSLFLDEPTSGLDATAALNVAEIMKVIAGLGIPVVAVIHQPRIEIYEQLDELVIIGPGGKTAYTGSASMAVPYFRNLGYIIHDNLNPADILMDILSGGGEHESNRYTPKELIHLWSKYEGKDQLRAAESSSEGEEGGENTNQNMKFTERATAIAAERGASWYKQIWYCHLRALIQSHRNASGFILEIFLGMFAGAVIGFASKASAGRLYYGVLVAPYEAISPAPFEWYVPFLGFLTALSIALAGAPAGVRIFGEERIIYYREASGGHGKLWYYIGKVMATLYRIVIGSFHYAAMFYFLAKPLTPFYKFFLIVLGVYLGVYGLSNLVSMFVRRENASLLAAVICVFAGTVNGWGPNLNEVRNDMNMIWFWDLFYARWANEAFYTLELEPYEGIYDIHGISAPLFGYTLKRSGLDLLYCFCVGTAYFIIGYFLLAHLNRDKQR